MNFTKDKDNIHKSIFLSHIEAYKKSIYENDDMSLILEDDSIPNDVFTENYEKYLKQLPHDFDLFLLVQAKTIFIFLFVKKSI